MKMLHLRQMIKDIPDEMPVCVFHEGKEYELSILQTFKKGAEGVSLADRKGKIEIWFSNKRPCTEENVW